MKRKKVIIILSVLIILVSSSIFVLVFDKKNVSKTSGLDENTKENTNKSLSMMLEQNYGKGDYVLTTRSSWPTEGYEFNATLSKCENGGTISLNESTHKISVKNSLSDKCYVYFDLIPSADVTITVTNNPTTYGKTGTVSCSGGNATYDQKYQAIKLTAIDNKYASCTLNYTDSTSKVNLASHIISLAGTTQGTGKVVNENGYRYEGKNPNNYVWFNNELWRIIGVFDSTTHGVANKNLVKIIRAETLDGLAWHKSNTNDWTAASLNKLLNDNYYNRTDGTSSGNCYGYSTTVQGNCDYSQKGIMSKYREMIQSVTWHLGGHSTNEATAETFYTSERGTTVYSGRPTSTTGYIGLMYPSDYGYSVLSSSCARTTNLESYGSSSCGGKSWLYGKGYESTLAPNSDSSYNVFHVSFNGDVSFSFADDGFGVRPVLYLKSSTYKISGEGTASSPYILGGE